MISRVLAVSGAHKGFTEMSETAHGFALSLFVSLLVLVALSGGVIYEAESNYGSVINAPSPTANVFAVQTVNDGLSVTLQVENTLNQRLRVQFVFIRVDDEQLTKSISVPIQERRSIAPGTVALEIHLPPRRVEGLNLNDSLRFEGHIQVAVYNGHTMRVSIEPEVIDR